MDQSAIKSEVMPDLLSELIKDAQDRGADAVDAISISSHSKSLSCRKGALEDAERAENTALGLRVLIGQRQAVVSSSDSSHKSRQALIERAIAMAKAAPADPYAGLADESQLAKSYDVKALDLHDASTVDENKLQELALKAEDTALAIEGITNSGGAEASTAEAEIALATSTGFSGRFKGSQFSISVSVLAGSGTAMERDYDYSIARHFSDLEDAALIGERAGKRTAQRLGASRIKTGKMPVVFDPRAGNSLLGHFAQAVNGSAIARGTSFLQGFMEKPVFAQGITIIDDPLRRRGLRSRPFDAEGLASQTNTLVKDGALQSWVLDCATARKLGLQSTAHATRSASSAPSPSATNLHMAAGSTPVSELIGAIGYGFYVTELIGMGVNPVTGDYSRGAAGFLIENGEITSPVSEVTIAGNLRHIFAHMVAADDLEFRYAMNTPTLLVEEMTVAGA